MPMLDLRTRVEMRIANDFKMDLRAVQKSPDIQNLVDDILDELVLVNA